MNIKENREILKRYAVSLINEADNMAGTAVNPPTAPIAPTARQLLDQVDQLKNSLNQVMGPDKRRDAAFVQITQSIQSYGISKGDYSYQQAGAGQPQGIQISQE